MAVNVSKVIYKGKTIIDITPSTVSPQTLLKGEKAFNSAGELIEGEAESSYLEGAEPVILVDEDGNEIAAVITDEVVQLTATPNDVRLGATALTDNGLITGEKVIPSHHTTEGVQLIAAGKQISITSLSTMELYNFTKLQAVICEFNTTLTNSVSVINVAIDGKVYAVQTTTAISDVVVNHEKHTIDFGIINDTKKPLILRFFTYKEII